MGSLTAPSQVEEASIALYLPKALRASNGVNEEYESDSASAHNGNIILAGDVPENRNSIEVRQVTSRPPQAAVSNKNDVPEITERDDNGQTPLHRAAESGNSELVKLLLVYGAERDARDYKKRLPLHFAASNGDLDTAIALLGPGKDMKDKYGQTPVHIAASRGKAEVVELLVDERADKEARDNIAQTPLHVAARLGQADVARVLVRKGANKGAKDMDNRTPLHLAADCATALALLEANIPRLPPQTYGQYQIHIRRIIHDHYSKIFNPDEPFVRELALEASKRGEDAASEFGLPADAVPGLVKLALHDFLILCDDSHSMRQGSRIPVLKDTLRRVARFAMYLKPTGISLRFLNHPADHSFDGLKSVKDIMKKLESIEFSGCSRLGTELNDKVVKPLIKKAEQRQLTRPLVVVIITDGEPNEEDPNTLRDTILKCKTSPAIKTYGDSAVVFLISQVGDSELATRFVGDLENDEGLGGMLYSSPARLDEIRAKFRAQNDDKQYTRWLIELFLAALGKHASGGSISLLDERRPSTGSQETVQRNGLPTSPHGAGPQRQRSRLRRFSRKYNSLRTAQ